MIYGRRLTTLVIIVVALNPARIESEVKRRARDTDNDGDLMAGMVRGRDQQEDRKSVDLKNHAAAAFEHAQRHHQHEGQIQGKPVIHRAAKPGRLHENAGSHHAKEPGQEHEKARSHHAEEPGQVHETTRSHHAEEPVQVHKKARSHHAEKLGQVHDKARSHHAEEPGQVHKKARSHHAEEPVQVHKKARSHHGDGKIRFQKDGEIHKPFEALKRRVREDGEEEEVEEDDSGEGEEHEIKRDIHYHIQKIIASDDEDTELETSAEGSGASRDSVRVEELRIHEKNTPDLETHPPSEDKNIQTENYEMHLHAHGKKDEEFGYITDEEEADIAETETEDAGHSGEENYAHDHIQTLDIHRRVRVVPATQHARDKHGDDHVDGIEHDFGGGEDEDDSLTENSGEDDGEGFDQREEHASKEHHGGGGKDEERVEWHHFDESVEEELSGSDEEQATRGTGGEERVSQDFHHKNREPTSGEDEGESSDKVISHRGRHHGNIHHKQKHGSGKLKHNNPVLDHEGKLIHKKTGQHHGHHQQKHNKDIDTASQRDAEKAGNEEEDLYIDENDEAREKLLEVELREDEGEESDHEHRQIDEGSETEQEEAVQDYRRATSRHLLQVNDSDQSDSSNPCLHPSHHGPIKHGAIVYVRAECRLCECNRGELKCEPESQYCNKHQSRPCPLGKGENVSDGERYCDGCKECLCRNGDLLCTRSRCHIAAPDLDNEISEDKPANDPCLECDSEPGSPVCGPNWKTYRSFCHAQECGGFNLEDVKQGTCESLDPCVDANCPEHQICLPHRRGPCLAITAVDGAVLECQQYQCVSLEQDCSWAPDKEVCGVDKKTYPSTCAMVTKSVALAYDGPCKDECQEDDPRMCGMDGVTIESTCHAKFYNSHVDYPGECDNTDDNDNLLVNSSVSDENFNRRCKIVSELERCPFPECKETVIPEGGCCRICGTAVSIRLDTAARDMIGLTLVKPPQDFNRLDFVYAKLQNLLNQSNGSSKCQLTIDLVDTNDISVVYTPIKSQEQVTCKEVANKTVALINSPTKNDMEPFEALLAAAVLVDQSKSRAAVLVDQSEPGVVSEKSMTPKKRKKRVDHHEHEPVFENSQARLQITVFNIVLSLGLYWFTIQVNN